ncbi:origin recognition complex subunit 6-domain-containing protein [Apiosordaria backusii]|uniref:Origin recognition complex subunit 6-domain-containing protein n=1 Tax=Apiosordaria backusii TaxID=314023 RepID=A0AA40EM19_9PEZI|nr:origin recognition complex subunit 6-domain-containing protein [Apiosordaria backusii]
MNRSIEQALLSLIPTHNAALPPPLTELASSLLAQSRHKASTLKAEEEIARPYACAHIACDRLKITLNLPPIEPRPPIPPRIYKRLYSHLDKILPSGTSTPGRGTPARGGPDSRVRTPSTKLREQHAPLGTSPLASKSRPLPGRTTPSKEKSLAEFRDSNADGTPSKRKLVTTPQSKRKPSPLPSWIRPTLRFLCKELGPASIGPVVASGVESIVAPHGKQTEDEWVMVNLVSLLGALYLFVWRGVNVKGDDSEKAWEGWYDVKLKDLDTAALTINRHGWLELDWAKGVEDLVRMNRERELDEEEDAEREARDAEPVQLRRADTMFQERYDFLTDRKRKAYAEWKEGIMKRINAQEG